ncbi:MAG: hydrogenase subunit MbhD domain-containing protein [Spirochaetales bacterium]
MIELLLFIHVILAILILWIRNLFTAVILLAVFSLFSAVLFFVLHAPDVALTEAAVGAGVSTFFYIWIVKHTYKERE